VVVAFATTDLWPNTVVLLLFFVLYQQVENYYIAPRVLRNTVELPSVAVLLVALIGASVLGLVGALIAIPVAASARVVIGPMLAARDRADAAAGNGADEESPGDDVNHGAGASGKPRRWRLLRTRRGERDGGTGSADGGEERRREPGDDGGDHGGEPP